MNDVLMAISVASIGERDRVFLDEKIASITSEVTQLAHRYRTQKSTALSDSDRVVAVQAKEDVESVLRCVMSLGVFVPRQQMTENNWGAALEAVVKLNEIWQKIRTHAVVDVSVLEEMMIETRKIRTVLDARIVSGKWL